MSLGTALAVPVGGNAGAPFERQRRALYEWPALHDQALVRGNTSRRTTFFDANDNFNVTFAIGKGSHPAPPSTASAFPSTLAARETKIDRGEDRQSCF